MKKHNRYTKEFLQPIVDKCSTWAEVCREIGIKPLTGSQANLTRKAKLLKVNYSHFKGQGWNKGKQFPKQQIPVELYLYKGSTIKSSSLRKKLIQTGLKKKECEICNLTDWQHKDIPLELHHINSDHQDNRIENLQILCANCHSQIITDKAVVGKLVDPERLERSV